MVSTAPPSLVQSFSLWKIASILSPLMVKGYAAKAFPLQSTKLSKSKFFMETAVTRDSGRKQRPLWRDPLDLKALLLEQFEQARMFFRDEMHRTHRNERLFAGKQKMTKRISPLAIPAPDQAGALLSFFDRRSQF